MLLDQSELAAALDVTAKSGLPPLDMRLANQLNLLVSDWVQANQQVSASPSDAEKTRTLNALGTAVADALLCLRPLGSPRANWLPNLLRQTPASLLYQNRAAKDLVDETVGLLQLLETAATETASIRVGFSEDEASDTHLLIALGDFFKHATGRDWKQGSGPFFRFARRILNLMHDRHCWPTGKAPVGDAALRSQIGRAFKKVFNDRQARANEEHSTT